MRGVEQKNPQEKLESRYRNLVENLAHYMRSSGCTKFFVLSKFQQPFTKAPRAFSPLARGFLTVAS